jgi:hypothetical protein
MNNFKRIFYRVIRELYRIKNKRYINLFEVESKKRPIFIPKISEDVIYIDTHIRPYEIPELEKPNKRTLIIHIPYGGLGDHILYSHIPRIAKQTGVYSNVYFSNKSVIRNPSHLEYIWKKNPYLDGFCDDENFHDYNSKLIATFDETKGNILDQIMLSYGIDDGTRWHEPELYFKIAFIPELEGKSVYDPNFISYSGGLTSKKVVKYLFDHNKKIDYQFPIRSTLALPILQFDTFIRDANFELFCSIIISCKELYSLTTGTATLASALTKSTTVFYGNQLDTYFLHSKFHSYILIK